MEAVEAVAATALAQSNGEMSFDEIMSSNAVVFERVPAWNGRVVGVQSITAGEIIQYLSANEDKDAQARREASLLLLARSFATAKPGADGAVVYERVCPTPEKQRQMVEALREKDAATVHRIMKRVLAINGLGEDAQAAAKNDSSATQPDAPPSN